jgi:hypothetical protein
MATTPDMLDYVLGLEATAEPWADHAHLSSMFRKTIEEMPEADPRRQYVSWEIQVHDYHLSHDQAEKGLLPMMVLGGQAYPAAIEEVPQEAVDYFKERLAISRRSSTRARLADFLWLRTKQFAFAEQAIAEYLQAVPEILPSTRGRSMACDYLGRVTHLVLSLRRDPAPLLAAIRSLAEQLLEDEDGHLVGLLMATRDAVDRDPSLSSWVIEQITALAAKQGMLPAPKDSWRGASSKRSSRSPPCDETPSAPVRSGCGSPRASKMKRPSGPRRAASSKARCFRTRSASTRRLAKVMPSTD